MRYYFEVGGPILLVGTLAWEREMACQTGSVLGLIAAVLFIVQPTMLYYGHDCRRHRTDSPSAREPLIKR
jgi:hypothetical protein